MRRAERSGLPGRLWHTLRRGVRARVRRRAFLLSLAVLPQLLALAALASIFWGVRVREIVVAPVQTMEVGDRRVLQCVVGPADVKKIAVGTRAEVELLDSADGVLAIGQGIISSATMRRDGSLTVHIAGAGLAEVLQRAPSSASPRARVAVRTRRALTVILSAPAGDVGPGRERRRPR